MCRIAAYLGPARPLEDIIVRPVHSLLTQSQHAHEAKLAVNGDGFGIAWYGRGEAPGLYRDVLPAWADGNLVSICRMVESHAFIGHIRASTVGETSRANCHPFVSGRWSFCHNGQVPDYPAIRRGFEAALPDALFHQRRGSTDSEAVFLRLLAEGLESDPAGAVARVIGLLPEGAGEEPVKLTCVLSDGAALFAFRHASAGRAPTLYVSGELEGGGRSVASEPLCGDPARWREVPQDVLVRVDAAGIAETPLPLACRQAA